MTEMFPLDFKFWSGFIKTTYINSNRYKAVNSKPESLIRSSFLGQISAADDPGLNDLQVYPLLTLRK